MKNIEKHHYIKTGSTVGSFRVAQHLYFKNMTNLNTSLASDGNFLFLYIGASSKSGMYKIGTG